MALIKVRAEPETRAEVLRITDIFRGKIVDVSPHFYTIEVTGEEGKITASWSSSSSTGLRSWPHGQGRVGSQQKALIGPAYRSAAPSPHRGH